MSRITRGSIGAADWVPERLHSAAGARGGAEPEAARPADELRLIAAVQRLRHEHLIALVRGGARRLWRRLARDAENARAARELGRMSDRDLADIGLYRCDIPAIAAGGARRLANGRKLNVR
jgi:uncharacterized protein YjiS (DUF1127 family)